MNLCACEKAILIVLIINANTKLYRTMRFIPKYEMRFTNYIAHYVLSNCKLNDAGDDDEKFNNLQLQQQYQKHRRVFG